MKIITRFILCVFVCVASQNTALQAQITLPAIFGDNMVLQQNSEVPIWGWADASAAIQLTTSWDTVVYKTKSANTTRWNLKIKTPKAGGPYTITIKNSDELTIKNIMIGEVWLCSGQSNMEWNSVNGFNNSEEEVKNANYPTIRLFHIKKMISDAPQLHCLATWKECSPTSVRLFSAIAYFFARHLQDSLNVPIGLINASWGGTSAENWVRKDRIINDKELLAFAKKQKDWPWCPGTIGEVYNAMIAPIIPTKIAGVIWYQGESNCDTYAGYTKLMSTLIKGWREDFQTELPFYFVQIAPHSYGDNHINAALLREAQAKTLSVPNTGMVVITDLVDNVKDIHPRNKQDVGKRLADLALSETYNCKGIVCQYPVYKSMVIQKDKIYLSFDNASNGLISKNGEPVCFEIAGADGKFIPATAKIEKNMIIVTAKAIISPVAVRFSFKNDAIGNIFNKEGLPLCPFRTDSL